MASVWTFFALCCRTYIIFFCVVLNWSFSSRTYLFSPMEQRSPKSNESRKVTAVSNKISEPDEKKTLEITHQMLFKMRLLFIVILDSNAAC